MSNRDDQGARMAKQAWVKPELKVITAGSAEKTRNDENIADGQGNQKS